MRLFFPGKRAWRPLCFLQEDFEESDGGQGVSCGAVTSFDSDAQVGAEAPQRIGGVPRQQFPGELHRAEFLTSEIIPQPEKFLPDETVIKMYIMGHENLSCGHLRQLPRNFVKPGRPCHHFIGDARQPRHGKGNIHFGIDQRGKGTCDPFSIMNING